MALYDVLLCPVDPTIEIDMDHLIHCLQDVQFIEAPCQPFPTSKHPHWSTGARFGDFFRYRDQPLSRAAPITPPKESESVCAVRFEVIADRIGVAASPLSKLDKSLICPNCGYPLPGEGVSAISSWWSDGDLNAQQAFTLTCLTCGAAHKIWGFDWADVVGFYRCGIGIDYTYRIGFSNIDESMWSVLREASNVVWHPVWLRY